MPAREIRFKDLTFGYPNGPLVLDASRPDDPRRLVAGHRGPERRRARPPSPSCCAVSTTRRSGAIEIDGHDLRSLDIDAWRARVTAVFQDFVRFELPLRDNVAPSRRTRRRDSGRARSRRRRAPGEPGHDPGARLRRWYRPLGRAVAARGARPRAVRGAPRRRRGAARRAHRPARRARRGRDLRSHPGRHARLHDHPDLASLLDRPPRRPHLRPRARPGDRAGHRTTS